MGFKVGVSERHYCTLITLGKSPAFVFQVSVQMLSQQESESLVTMKSLVLKYGAVELSVFSCKSLRRWLEEAWTETSEKDIRKQQISSSLGEHIYLVLENMFRYQCKPATAKKQQREIYQTSNAKRSWNQRTVTEQFRLEWIF